LNEPVRGY